ncbi:MAG: DUF1311 domain-containing protein [Gammaproteobacteria bacterium]|nr:DUF1311 domain-containing protein [Gammaproteobacteria bacterium]
MKTFLFLLLLACAGSLQAESPDCEQQAGTTMDMNLCIAEQVAAADRQLERYLETALERYSDDQAVVDLLLGSQDAWLDYRKTYCDAIYQMWSGGTIRGVMAGNCALQLIQQRTQQIWWDFLTYMDSTPPLLPEPK